MSPEMNIQTTQTGELENLLRRGNAAARVGNTQAARDAYQQVLDRQPGSIEALLGLASIAETVERKREYFQRVLDVDPNNADAREGLALLSQLAMPVATAEISPTNETVAPLVDTDVMYCANHPKVETRLRCNRCGKPICPRCGELTPVGYRCKTCIRGQQAVFYNAGPADLVIAGVISFVLGGIAASLVPRFGLFIGFFVSPVVGGVVAEVVHRAVGRRRGQYTWLVVCAGLVFSALFVQLPALFGILFLADPRFIGGFGLNLLSVGLYLVLAVVAASSRLRFGK